MFVHRVMGNLCTFLANFLVTMGLGGCEIFFADQLVNTCYISRPIPVRLKDEKVQIRGSYCDEAKKKRSLPLWKRTEV
jgi:hypothetical protein